jgi:sugar phosphate isomerase/epimerase
VRVGVFTALLANLSLDQVIAKLKSLGVTTVELGTGNYPGDPHCKLSMLEDSKALGEFRKQLADNGIAVSALSCHGDPLHPNAEIARANQETNRRTILLAEKLGVPVVVDFSGCPGDSETSKYPNWVTCAWPPHFQDILAWQWDKVVIPYWKERAKFAADHGVKVALEMHPGYVVYSPETMLRLRAAAGPNLGCNFDPSHLFWQGIDPVAAVRALRECIFHVHAKDTKIDRLNVQVNGVLDNRPYADEPRRSWLFRTVGYGNGATFWKELISALRIIGYDYVLSIEHEDSLMSGEEGLRKAVAFLKQVMIEEPRGAMWWD